MKKLPAWLHKKNLNLIETQGIVETDVRRCGCGCGEEILDPDSEYGPICETTRDIDSYFTEEAFRPITDD